MDQIRDAFTKVKRDMDSLYFEMDSLKLNLKEINFRLSLLSNDIQNLSKMKLISSPPKNDSFNQVLKNPTQDQSFPTHNWQIPTQKSLFNPLNAQNQGISIGNDGVPTDKQTNQQTNQQTQNTYFNPEIMIKTTPKNPHNPIQTAAEILDSLDSLKKEIRLKFKRLTEQEVLVFSTLYQLDEENGNTDYKSLSERLNLTESSIRDYIGRLINKGIPVEKTKIHNKSIKLSISQDLKKIASLSTIMQLIHL
jgi:predicted transcriptional regulator